jgi:hypothetical protein
MLGASFLLIACFSTNVYVCLCGWYHSLGLLKTWKRGKISVFVRTKTQQKNNNDFCFRFLWWQSMRTPVKIAHCFFSQVASQHAINLSRQAYPWTMKILDSKSNLSWTNASIITSQVNMPRFSWQCTLFRSIRTRVPAMFWTPVCCNSEMKYSIHVAGLIQTAGVELIEACLQNISMNMPLLVKMWKRLDLYRFASICVCGTYT